MDRKNVSFKITITYFLMSISWIIFSESVILGLTNSTWIQSLLFNIQQYAFIVITSFIIYYMVKRENDKRNDIENNLLKIANIIKSSQDAIIGSDLEGIITSWNPGAEKMFEYTSNEAIGTSVNLVFPSRKQHLIPLVLDKVKLGEMVDYFQLEMLNKSGEEIEVSITISPIKNTFDEIVGISLIAIDMTKQKEDERRLQLSYQELTAVYEQLAATEEELRAQFEELQDNQQQIEEMVYYDVVTQLPNRVLFTDRLNIELNKSKENKSKGMVLFLDLDDFKKVNDTLGHDYGDKLLKNIGEMLKRCVEHNDTVARFSGDEFLILMPRLKDYTECLGMVQRVLDNFKNAFQIEEKQIYVTASIGIAIYPDDGETVQSVIKNVDTAMYAAKSNGKNTYYFFDEDISNAILRKTEIEKGLREALKNNELIIYYQPQVNIKTGKIHGLEALVRWNSKELGFVSPMEFIPIAEETGLIKELGEWIIRTSCRESKRLKSKGFKFNTISVNVSAIQLQQPDFISTVKNILLEEGLEPHFLEIEITESILMKRLEENVKHLNDLRRIGVKTALDDFGTGYSSLRYLRMLPLNTLKIDKSFIDGICFNESDKDITEGIIQLAHKINLDVVIEGVEVKNQVSLLKEMGCNLIQGYYFSKPLPIEKIEELLEKRYFDV